MAQNSARKSKVGNKTQLERFNIRHGGAGKDSVGGIQCGLRQLHCLVAPVD